MEKDQTNILCVGGEVEKNIHYFLWPDLQITFNHIKLSTAVYEILLYTIIHSLHIQYTYLYAYN